MPRHPLSGCRAPKRRLAGGAAPGSSQATHDKFFKKIIYSANRIMYCVFEGSRRNGFAAAGLEETTLTFC
jgi:hypothetical protein